MSCLGNRVTTEEKEGPGSKRKVLSDPVEIPSDATKKKKSKTSDKKAHHDGSERVDDLCSGDSFYIPNFLSPEEAKGLYDHLLGIDYVPRGLMTMMMYEKKVTFPRDKQFFGDTRKEQRENGGVVCYSPDFRYGGDYTPKVLDWPKEMRDINKRIKEETRLGFNHCVVNRYLNGSDYISYHHDKTRDMQEGTGVICLSLGVDRRLLFKHLATKKVVEIIVRPGSLYYIGPKTNSEWQHSIPKDARVTQPRISCTLRLINNWRVKEEEK